MDNRAVSAAGWLVKEQGGHRAATVDGYRNVSQVASGSALPPFAELLIRYRRAARLTQEELAAASGVSARTISDMERGRVRGPQHRSAYALGTALALDEHALWEFLRTAKAGRARAHGPRGTRTGAPADVPTTALDHLPLGLGLCALPAEVADITGRENDLARVIELVDAGGGGTAPCAANVIVIVGIPGVGKTTFAVHAAHRLSARYPDGCFFVDLRGLGDDRLTAGQALSRLLVALGVAESAIPARTEERSGLLRALLRNRRVLLVIDNAADEAQVRPLLPGAAGSLVVVTARRALAGLESVHRMFLETLSPDAGVRLLGSIIGSRRTADEPRAARRLVDLCGLLPLAVRIAGNRLASRPGWTIDGLVRQLGDPRHRLSTLTAGDLQVRSVCETSYQHCAEPTRHVFRRLGLVAGQDVTVEVAAVVTRTDVQTARRALEELTDAGLLSATVHGRYRLHDLIRVFAGERLTAEEPSEHIDRARRRLTDWALDTAIRAGTLVSPTGAEAEPMPRSGVAGTAGAGLATGADAMRWLDTERSCWLATLRAVRAERHRDVLTLCTAMRWYRGLRPTGVMWREVFTYGVAAARALGRRADEAAQLNLLGWALRRNHDLHQESVRTHLRAVRIAWEVGDRREAAWALQHLGHAELVQGRPGRAIDLFDSAVALFGELANPLGEHLSLSFLGVALRAVDRYHDAVDTHRRAVAYFRYPVTVADRNLLAFALVRLADAHAASGDLASAYTAYREAGAVAAGAGSPLVEGLAWFGCGRCQHELGDPDAARRYLDIALGIFTEHRECWLQARVLHRLARVVEPVDPVRARDARAWGLALCARLGTPRARALAASLSRSGTGDCHHP